VVDISIKIEQHLLMFCGRYLYKLEEQPSISVGKLLKY